MKSLETQLLRCPSCHSQEWSERPTSIRCTNCGKVFELRKGKPVFEELESEALDDPLDRLKHRLKQYPQLYAALVKWVAPLHDNGRLDRFIEERIEGRDVVAVNLGSGPTDLHPAVSNVDLIAYEPVNLVCDIHEIPLAADSVDVVINREVLEHVPEPERVVSEMHRILKPGGWIYSAVPFIQGFHASPHDYSRRTARGLELLHSPFECVELTSNGGPSSALAWILHEWLALALSFGHVPTYRALYLALLPVTTPIKFLDRKLEKHPLAHHIAADLVFIGRKAPSNA